MRGGFSLFTFDWGSCLNFNFFFCNSFNGSSGLNLLNWSGFDGLLSSLNNGLIFLLDGRSFLLSRSYFFFGLLFFNNFSLWLDNFLLFLSLVVFLNNADSFGKLSTNNDLRHSLNKRVISNFAAWDDILRLGHELLHLLNVLISFFSPVTGLLFSSLDLIMGFTEMNNSGLAIFWNLMSAINQSSKSDDIGNSLNSLILGFKHILL